ncbi:Os08g0354700 [Oryza sativa Japonica Group]|uniref:Os08g0354700 protein n=1 Tax=Oryza sativa subsp. japonica TaxID=39947 RepID=A0A0P0XEV4_ORYSJ|nr:Os08g0354700 [Oryza sativa Japonica Group]
MGNTMRPEGGGWRYCHARRLVAALCPLRHRCWMVTALALLLFSVLAGGGCLAGYIVLLSNETPHWLPAVGRVDVLQAFLSVLATACTGARTERLAISSAVVAPAARSVISRS